MIMYESLLGIKRSFKLSKWEVKDFCWWNHSIKRKKNFAEGIVSLCCKNEDFCHTIWLSALSTSWQMFIWLTKSICNIVRYFFEWKNVKGVLKWGHKNEKPIYDFRRDVILLCRKMSTSTTHFINPQSSTHKCVCRFSERGCCYFWF